MAAISNNSTTTLSLDEESFVVLTEVEVSIAIILGL